jgi:hypothetical protein
MHHRIQQLAGAGEPGLGALVLRLEPDRLVDPGAGRAPCHAQQPAIVQALQQMRADVQVAAPALDPAMIELRLHVPGVSETLLAHKGQHLLRAPFHPGVPNLPGARLPARMQQGQGLARQETVVDEEGLFDRQTRVATLQLAGAIVFHPLREDEILGASGRPHRVGLDKAQARNGPREGSGLEQAARDRVAPKLREIGDFERAHAWRPMEVNPEVFVMSLSG